MICPDQCAEEVLTDNIITPSLTPTIHISCVVLTSSKTEYSFTALPNPYNGFDRVSSFPVTISLNNPRWTEETKKILIPTRGSVVKITGVISSVHPDSDNVNHWVVTASEIYFLKETVSISKPTIPGTGETTLTSLSHCSLTPSLVRTEKPGKAFSYSAVSPSPVKRQRTELD